MIQLVAVEEEDVVDIIVVSELCSFFGDTVQVYGTGSIGNVTSCCTWRTTSRANRELPQYVNVGRLDTPLEVLRQSIDGFVCVCCIR